MLSTPPFRPSAAEVGADAAGEVLDTYGDDRPAGEVVGAPARPGLARLGVDAERVIAIDNGALRVSPLVAPGWGRAGLAYGPYRREAGLAFAVSILNGHNTSQAENLPEGIGKRLLQWLMGSNGDLGLEIVTRLRQWLASPRKADMARRLVWWMHTDARARRIPRLDENLAAGWFTGPAEPDPTTGGNGFVMHALGPDNGELWARVGGRAAPLVRGVQNVPLLFVVVLRRRGAAYYAASLPGARGLAGHPRLRPLAIDARADEPILFAGFQQSVLGQIGFRAETRVYGVQVARLPAWRAWFGTAHAADDLQGDGALAGSTAEAGGRWAGGPAFARGPTGAAARADGHAVVDPGAPSGLVHVIAQTAEAPRGRVAVLLRFRDPGAHWAFEIDEEGCRLAETRDGAERVVAAAPGRGWRPRAEHALQVTDDGQTMTAFLDGEPLVSAPAPDGGGTGLGLRAAAAAPGLVLRQLEAHPRAVPMPEPLRLPFPAPRRAGAAIAADDFGGPAGPLAGRATPLGGRRWRRLEGAGAIELTGGGAARVRASVEAPNPGRTIYGIPWDRPGHAELEAVFTPPGTARGQGQRARGGFVFWQDPRNYIAVSMYLDDSYPGASISSFFHLDGFEELYDAVWTMIGDRISWGRPCRFRLSFDGLSYLAHVDGEPVLFRALTDVYPDARRLQIRRVGLIANWEWGDDTGSEIRDFVARGADG